MKHAPEKKNQVNQTPLLNEKNDAILLFVITNIKIKHN